MACLDEQTVVAFVGGALAGARLAEVERHLLGCPDCSTLNALASPNAAPRRTNTLEWAGAPAPDEAAARAAAEVAAGARASAPVGSVTEVIDSSSSAGVDPGPDGH